MKVLGFLCELANTPDKADRGQLLDQAESFFSLGYGTRDLLICRPENEPPYVTVRERFGVSAWIEDPEP